MGFERDSKTIERLVLSPNGRVRWNELKYLQDEDFGGKTRNYESALSILERRGIIKEGEGFFVYGRANGAHLGPIKSGNLVYFANEEYTKAFAKVFHPNELVARVLKK